jgi:hypothetical protein
MNSNEKRELSWELLGHLGLALGILSLSGCGGLKTRNVDEPALARVKKVAVVAFTLDQPAAVKLSLNVGNGQVEGDRGGSLISKNATETDQMLAALQSSLKERMRWSVKQTPEMVKAPGYVSAFDRTMKGFQNKMPPHAGMNRFLAAKVMDFDSVRILGPEGRDALCAALGVDAIVAAKVDVALGGTKIMGIGARKPRSSVSLAMYSKGVETPVWFEGRVEGDESSESVGSTNLIDEELLNRLSLESARTAFKKLSTAAAL